MPMPKIAILGAGPAGLTLARLLQIKGIPCTVYEGEADRYVRGQGGSLDLHPRAGQAALKAAGLYEQFMNHARPEGQALKLLRYDGQVLIDENVSGSRRPQDLDDRPEIDRVKLREILLDSLEPSSIKWNHRVAKVEPDPAPKGKHTVVFSDGTRESAIDLLIGADGAWSKVRPLLTDITPFYSGITGVELSLDNVAETNPSISNFVGAGSCFMFDEGRAIQAQRDGEGRVRTYVWVRKPEDWMETCGIDWGDGPAVRSRMIDDYLPDVAESLKNLVLSSTSTCTPRKLYMLPTGLTWRSQPGITLIGDAAHLMTPFAGVGVNLALADAMQLAKQLVSRKNSFVAKALSDERNIATAIARYEKEMFARSEEFARKTEHGLRNHFSAKGGEEMVVRLEEHLKAKREEESKTGGK